MSRFKCTGVRSLRLQPQSQQHRSYMTLPQGSYGSFTAATVTSQTRRETRNKKNPSLVFLVVSLAPRLALFRPFLFTMASEGRPAASTRFSGELQQPLLGPGVLRAAKIIQIAAMTGPSPSPSSLVSFLLPPHPWRVKAM